MTKNEAKKRIEKLKKEINHHRYQYHVLDKQEISDAALDSLKKELFDLEGQFPDLVAPDSPTQRIGGKPLAKFKKVEHEKRMLSFNDAFSEEDMKNWLIRLENHLDRKMHPEFYCELKLDGLAIELIYENGLLIQASTRGDGRIGEDVTQNIKTIESIPLSLNVSSRIIVRGEVFLTKKEFNRINKALEKEDKKTYANPRNLAAGSIRQLNPNITAGRKLDSFMYDIVTDKGFKFHSEEHEQLKKWGFKINTNNRKAESLREVFKLQEYWNKHRDKLPYEIDGLVVIVNQNKIFEDGGVIGKAPRAAIAYKFAARETTTIVEDIQVQVGRTGHLTPVAKLKPVMVGGVTISNATLHNYDEIKRLGVKIGDTVIVSRAGDVIPQITKVLVNLRTGKEKNFHMPDKCPLCDSKVERSGVYYICSNKKCAAIHREQLYHFVARAAFNIEGLGGKIIDKFLDEGLISDAADIFTLEKGDIAVLDGFGEKSADNIVNEINQRKKIPLHRFLYGLGIHHVGEETSRVLANEFDGVSKIKEVSLEHLQKISDIGPVVAKSIYEWFRDERNLNLLDKLEKVGVEIIAPEHSRKAVGGKLSNKVFVLTGSLESLARDEAKDKIRALGGDVNESVSKKTDYVVVGDDPGSKYEKAKKLGVKTLNEKEFLAMMS